MFYVIAALSTILIGAFYLTLVRTRLPEGDRRMLLLLAGLTFFMPGLTFYAVRLHLDAWLHTILDSKGATYTILTTWYAPVTEELAKLWPLVIPSVRRWITTERVPGAAFALGCGFGVGEIAFLGALIGTSPAAQGLPWYQLLGFPTERLLVAPCHALFVLASLTPWRRWKWPGGLALGFAGAAALHFGLNIPIFFKSRGWLGSSEAIAGQLLLVWIMLYFAVTVLVFSRMFLGKGATIGQFLLGEVDCILCGVHYARPLIAFNFGSRRYERCPACRKWHWQ